PHFESDRRQNVALLAIHIMQQGDTGTAIRIVFNRRDHRHNPVLVTLEIDLAIGFLMPAATKTRRDASRAAASAGSRLALHQALFRLLLGDFLARDYRLKTACRRSRSETFYRHVRSPRTPASSRRPSKQPRLFSSPRDSPKTCRAGATCPPSWTCEPPPPSL